MSERAAKVQNGSALTLRDRIAAALEQADPQCASLALADAVIAELQLKPERDEDIRRDGYCRAVKIDTRIRYVTDWKADDE